VYVCMCMKWKNNYVSFISNAFRNAGWIRNEFFLVKQLSIQNQDQVCVQKEVGQKKLFSIQENASN